MHKIYRPFLLISLTLLCSATMLAQQGYYLVTGTYTTGKSEGIYIYRFNTATGEASPVSVTKGIRNPSYLTVSGDNQFVYAVSELNGGGDAGTIVSYKWDASAGTLSKINEIKSGGDDPCYITTEPSGKWVIAGNYSSGSLSVISLDANGSLVSTTDRIVHKGKGPNIGRQEKAHVHSTVFSPDYRFLYVPDLGIDKVMIYNFDRKSGKLSPADTPYFTAASGSGPRHFVFDPNGRYAYLIQELTGQVTACAWDKKTGALKKIQEISTLATGFKGEAGSADIHISPDGKFLYASNRGDANNIAMYRINSGNGTLTLMGLQSVLGKHPRNFTIDPTGKYLLVANRDSDEVVVFARDTNTGRLTDTGKRIAVPNPVCLQWVKR